MTTLNPTYNQSPSLWGHEINNFGRRLYGLSTVVTLVIISKSIFNIIYINTMYDHFGPTLQSEP